VLKSFTFIFILLGASLAANAGAESSEVSMQMPSNSLHSNIANINQGNFEVSGSLNIGYTPSAGDLATSLSPAFRYFFLDSFSAGIATEAAFAAYYSEYGAGPSLAFYFLHSGRWAFFIAEDVLLKRSYSTAYYSNGYSFNYTRTNGISISKLGANYFVTRDVAVGPSLIYNRILGEGESSNTGYLNLIGQFSIYF
jgi:hypothetical protein